MPLSRVSIGSLTQKKSSSVITKVPATPSGHKQGRRSTGTALQVTRSAGKMLKTRRSSEQRSKKSQLEQAFAIFDKNHDGKISKEEVGNVLTDAGVQFTAGQLDVFMKKLDTDGDGEVDYAEFCGLMKDLVSSAASMEGDMKEAFSHIDVDGDGKVSKAELRQSVLRLGENMTEKEADDIIKTVDINGDEHIDYEEFVTLMLMLNIVPSNE